MHIIDRRKVGANLMSACTIRQRSDGRVMVKVKLLPWTKHAIYFIQSIYINNAYILLLENIPFKRMGNKNVAPINYFRRKVHPSRDVSEQYSKHLKLMRL